MAQYSWKCDWQWRKSKFQLYIVLEFKYVELTTNRKQAFLVCPGYMCFTLFLLADLTAMSPTNYDITTSRIFSSIYQFCHVMKAPEESGSDMPDRIFASIMVYALRKYFKTNVSKLQ